MAGQIELEELARQLGVPADVAQHACDAGGPTAVRTLAAHVGAQRLAESMADFLGHVVVQVDQGELDADAAHRLGPELAWRHLALPLAEMSEHISVAFANPFDRDARAAVEAASGRRVEAMVAAVDVLERTLERVLGPQPIDGANTSTDALPAEHTQKLERLPTPRTQRTQGLPQGTQPIHRLEDEASIDQRHRALLLALIDAGLVTHDAYLEALRRVLRADARRD